MKLLNLFKWNGQIHGANTIYARYKYNVENERRFSELHRTIRRLKLLSKCDVAIGGLKADYDLALVNPGEDTVSLLRENGFETVRGRTTPEVISSAWKERVRETLRQSGFVELGNVYVPLESVWKGGERKQGVRIQSVFENQKLAVWVDPTHKVMRPLSKDELKQGMGVMVFPWWRSGTLEGVSGKSAGEELVPYNGGSVSVQEYWMKEHGIPIKSNDKVLRVRFENYKDAALYPVSCVFKVISEPDFGYELRLSPGERKRQATEFVQKYLSRVKFFGVEAGFIGPLPPEYMGYKVSLCSRKHTVVVGGGAWTDVKNVGYALAKHGPHSGPIDGLIAVVHSCDTATAMRVADRVRECYKSLRLGELKIYEDVGQHGFIRVSDPDFPDDEVGKAMGRASIEGKKVIALQILPEERERTAYRELRGYLYNERGNPIPVQSITVGKAGIVARGERAEYILRNVAIQLYAKLGFPDRVPWILKEPADAGVPGASEGRTAYIFKDSSRRQEERTTVSVNAIVFDPYGNVITVSSSFPRIGEKTYPGEFADLVRKILNKMKNTKRIVYYKDGVLYPDEAESIAEELRKQGYPGRLSVILASVRKKTAKRVFEENGNAKRGTMIDMGSAGLLVSSEVETGTAIPLEFGVEGEVVLPDGKFVRKSNAFDTMREYFAFCDLNWASLYFQGKFALPHRLVQNVGELESAGVRVPKDTLVI